MTLIAIQRDASHSHWHVTQWEYYVYMCSVLPWMGNVLPIGTIFLPPPFPRNKISPVVSKPPKSQVS